MSQKANPQSLESAEQASERPRLLASGLDSLYVSYYFAVAHSTLDFDHLEYLKQKVRDSRDRSFQEIELGSERFALLPYGSHPYRYVLRNDAFEVRLTEHMQPCCYVQFFSEALWLLGLDELTARFTRWHESVGLKPTQPEVVSRADWAFDYHLANIDFVQEHFVSRAAKDSRHRNHCIAQTFTFGRGDVVFRVYDKVAEIEEQSGKAWLYEIWGQRQDVWRVEMQVRKDRLQLAGIHTIADLKELQNDLLRELASDHTTLRRPTEDSNRSRWPLHPLWQALLADIAALPQTGLVRSIDPMRPLGYRLDRTTQSVHGLLKAVGALVTVRDGLDRPPTLEQVLAALPRLLARHHNPLLWRRALVEKVAAWKLGQW